MVKFASAPMVKVFWTRTLAFPISLEIKAQYITLHYITLYYITLHYITLQYSAVQYLEAT